MKSKWLSASLGRLWLLFVLLFFAGTASYGVYDKYTPVPIWDMWDQHLDFYYRAQTDGWTAWWEQHNEHRLVLAKIFFWADMHFFRGNLILLFALNLVFAAASFVTLASFFIRTCEPAKKAGGYFFLALLAACCFSWTQWENFLWAFQSQFHMAYLLPLWSFLTLGLAYERNSTAWFSSALLLGFASAFTMANGVMVLPLMFVMAILCGFSRLKIGLVAATFTLCALLFFHDYHWVQTHVSFEQGIWSGLKDPVIYFFKYLSGPLYVHAADRSWVFIVSGLVFLAACLFAASRVFQLWRRKDPGVARLLAVLFFVLFIGGTAVNTAVGRFYISMHVPSRYMTPSLLAWSCIILLLFVLSQQHARLRRLCMVVSVILVGLLMPPQRDAVAYLELPHKIRVASLALQMNVQDSERLRLLYWDTSRVFQLAANAGQDKKSFSSINYATTLFSLETATDHGADRNCLLEIESATVVSGAPGYLRVLGWIYAPDLQQVPPKIVFDAGQKTVGYAISGERRKDIRRRLNEPAARLAGFEGYLHTAGLEGQTLVAYGADFQNRVLCAATVEQGISEL